MGAAADFRSRRWRWRALWVLAAAGCLAFAVVIPGEVARTIRLVKGPSVVLPASGFDAVAIAPDGRTLYAADSGPDGYGHTVTPVDLATHTAGKPIAVGLEPQELAITPDGRMLYAILFSGLIMPVTLATGQAMAPIHVPGGAYSMAVSPDSRTLYVGTGTSNEIAVVDIATGHRRTPISLPTPASGSVSPNAIAVTPDGRTLYVAESDSTVIPVSLPAGRPGTPIDVGNADQATPTALAVTPDGRTLYVADDGDYFDGEEPSSLVAVSTATGTVRTTIPYSPGPIALTVAPDGRTLYVLNSAGDVSTDVSTVIPVGTADGSRPGPATRTSGLFSDAGGMGMVIAPDGGTLYVAQGDVVVIGLPRLSGLL